MAEPFDEAAFRTAVDMWERDPKRATTHRILTGARPVLRMLDDARRDRNGFVEEIRDLNDQLAGARANVTALKTSCQSLQDLVGELRAEAHRLAEQVAVERRRGMGAVQ